MKFMQFKINFHNFPQKSRIKTTFKSFASFGIVNPVLCIHTHIKYKCSLRAFILMLTHKMIYANWENLSLGNFIQWYLCDMQVACPIRAIISSQSEVLLFHFFSSSTHGIHFNALQYFKTRRKERNEVTLTTLDNLHK